MKTGWQLLLYILLGANLKEWIMEGFAIMRSLWTCLWNGKFSRNSNNTYLFFLLCYMVHVPKECYFLTTLEYQDDNSIGCYLQLIYLNIVLIPGWAPEQESWNTREEASKDATEETRFVESLSILVDETGFTAKSTHANAAVSATVEQSLIPWLGSHFSAFYVIICKY